MRKDLIIGTRNRKIPLQDKFFSQEFTSNLPVSFQFFQFFFKALFSSDKTSGISLFK